MEQLIPLVNQWETLINELEEQFGAHSLPSIVVVGCQSQGKSSVLEKIIKRDFIPKGHGIVTRRPLIVQLVRSPQVIEEYGEFLHRPNKQFNYEEIRNEIEAENTKYSLNHIQQAVGLNHPIYLRIYSPNVLNLRLIDLPGMSRVSVPCCPPQIEIDLHSLSERFISDPNTIILSVTGANTDVLNAPGFLLATKIDPEGMLLHLRNTKL